ncbi:NAD-dependent epimerase/dehydratase family protein [Clostridium estertheticum]|uniref:NAD-dependent epimerase/dehydratase family protein n=1 Tax=Clostridium estertheticum TaxID=238834 RepID=UPI00124C25B2|nr:NAD(P)-dependent oxidoreductase [Clostridium estertheticum]MBU3170206.1 NAD(P)-dependent oxidoreductase [Clostridium estertheticum]MBZ9617014.1 NAD(P)-dependent oxidoreductase [Clostridium estertheticum subsp. laramiense]WAG72715.1 NAD(P)-dependent oxidoreductase [Clostridium estertheticum]
MKKVIVTGGSGFIGYNTLKYLLSEGYEVHALTSKNVEVLECNNVIWHKANLLEKCQVQKIIKEIQPTDILHFAWYAVPGKYNNAEENMLWLESSMELLKCFKLYGGKRFVFAGTCFQYDLNYGYLSEKLSHSEPNSLYGICKYSFENIAMKYCANNGISFASGRIFYLYGELEKANRIIPYVINCLINNEIAHCSHGNQIRDFLNVKDVSSAFVEILQSNIEGNVNIGSGEGVKLKDILLRVGKKLGKKDFIHFGDVKTSPDEPEMIVANNKRLRTETNWVQKFDLDNGIDETINWWIKKSKG